MQSRKGKLEAGRKSGRNHREGVTEKCGRKEYDTGRCKRVQGKQEREQAGSNIDDILSTWMALLLF